MNVKLLEEGVVRVNGRNQYLSRIKSLEQVSSSIWSGETIGGVKFKIEGGKKAGGSARDWFLDVEGWNGGLPCTSFVDAITTINNA